MKKIIVSIFAGFCFLIVAVPGHADADDYKTKLKDGFDIIIKSPLPLIDSVKEEYHSAEFKPFGVFGGLLKGSFYMLKEFSHGVYRVVTFNVWDDNFVSNMFNKEERSE